MSRLRHVASSILNIIVLSFLPWLFSTTRWDRLIQLKLAMARKNRTLFSPSDTPHSHSNG